MIDLVFKIISRDDHVLPIGTVGGVSLPAQEPQPPSPKNVHVFVRVKNLPYPTEAKALAILNKPHLKPLFFGSSEFEQVSLYRWRLDYSQARPETIISLTEDREVIRDWETDIRPALIDNTTGEIATDKALGLA